MKNLLIALAAVALFAACSKSDEPESMVNIRVMPPSGDTIVTISFCRAFDIQPMTRASVSDVSTRLDVWIVEGENITEVHQTSSDAGFGTITTTLDKTKTYTLYAVSHKCAAAATLTDGVISFPDDKVKDTFWYTTTFSPATITSVSCEMERIVSMFRIETTDAVPDEVKKMRITQKDVFDRWNVYTGATHQLDRISTINITSTAQDGTIALSVYSIVTDAQTLHNVIVEALDADDNVVQTQTLANVPLRNGFKTVCRGTFFTSANMSMSFTAASDWGEYNVTY